MNWATRILTATVTALAAVIVMTSPAPAHPIDYLNWKDNHTLCKNCGVDKGNVVGFWQSILVADGIEGGGHVPWWCNIDGYFGSYTRGFAKGWQAHYGLTSDGIVGQHTWNKASAFIEAVKFNGRNYKYIGYETDVYFQILRDKSGNLIWQPAYPREYPYYDSNHPAITFPRGGRYCG